MLNPLHHPDLDRCRELEKIGFPKTYYEFLDFDGEYQTLCPIMPSVSEMLDVIPEFINYETDYQKNGEEKTVKRKCRIEITKLDLGYVVKIRDEDFAEPKDWNGGNWKTFGGTLPNALADLIIWLVENNYLTFPNNV